MSDQVPVIRIRRPRWRADRGGRRTGSAAATPGGYAVWVRLVRPAAGRLYSPARGRRRRGGGPTDAAGPARFGPLCPVGKPCRPCEPLRLRRRIGLFRSRHGRRKTSRSERMPSTRAADGARRKIMTRPARMPWPSNHAAARPTAAFPFGDIGRFLWRSGNVCGAGGAVHDRYTACGLPRRRDRRQKVLVSRKTTVAAAGNGRVRIGSIPRCPVDDEHRATSVVLAKSPRDKECGTRSYPLHLGERPLRPAASLGGSPAENDSAKAGTVATRTFARRPAPIGLVHWFNAFVKAPFRPAVPRVLSGSDDFRGEGTCRFMVRCTSTARKESPRRT